MSRYRVELSPRAQADLERITQWWAENLPSNIEIFDREIAHAFAMLAELPEAGPACNRLDRSGTRRTLLRKTQYHIYYRIDRAAGLVNILALWHTARRRPPRL